MYIKFNFIYNFINIKVPLVISIILVKTCSCMHPSRHVAAAVLTCLDCLCLQVICSLGQHPSCTCSPGYMLYVIKCISKAEGFQQSLTATLPSPMLPSMPISHRHYNGTNTKYYNKWIFGLCNTLFQYLVWLSCIMSLFFVKIPEFEFWRNCIPKCTF